jgi:hypothetical protein
MKSPHQFQSLLDDIDSIPADMFDLLRRIAGYDPGLLDSLDERYLSAWRSGRELAEGRGLLQAIAAYVVAQQRKQTHAT